MKLGIGSENWNVNGHENQLESVKFLFLKQKDILLFCLVSTCCCTNKVVTFIVAYVYPIYMFISFSIEVWNAGVLEEGSWKKHS